MKFSRRGFSALEILITVAILVTIAAVAIPSVITHRINANEGAAIGNLGMLQRVLASYAAVNANLYPGTFHVTTSDLYLSRPPYLTDRSFGTSTACYSEIYGEGIKQGYLYFYQPADRIESQGKRYATSYTLYAYPSNVSGGSIEPNAWRFNGRRAFRVMPNSPMQWIWYGYEDWGDAKTLQ